MIRGLGFDAPVLEIGMSRFQWRKHPCTGQDRLQVLLSEAKRNLARPPVYMQVDDKLQEAAVFSFLSFLGSYWDGIRPCRSPSWECNTVSGNIQRVTSLEELVDGLSDRILVKARRR